MNSCWFIELKTGFQKRVKKVIITGNMSCDMELKYIFKIFNVEIFRTMSNLELDEYTV